MNPIRLISLAVALSCAGCKTLIVRPSPAPECIVPVELKSACVETAALAQQITYGDLPDVVLRSRQDFVECRKTYVNLLQSYEFCTSQLRKYNEKLKTFEDETRRRYKDAEVVEN